MNSKAIFSILAVIGLAVGIGLTPTPKEDSYIVQGTSLDAVSEAVESIGGDISHELGIINAVAATLTPAQHSALRDHAAALTITQDAKVHTAGGPTRTPSTSS